MRVAALYDIHGNLPALDAALADLGDIDLVVIGGDFLWGPMPAETLDRLRSLDVPTVFIHGNTERSIYTRKQESDYAEANAWCADQLTDDDLAFLRALPGTHSVDIDGLGPVLFCHGTPRDDEEPFTTATEADRVEEACDGYPERVVVCGHTHAQFDRAAAGRRVVNAGSVGMPFGDRPGAYWAVLGPDVDLRFTSYDVNAAADQLRATRFPWVEPFVREVLKPAPASLAAEIFTR